MELISFKKVGVTGLRTTKGAIKLHVKLNHSGYLPNFAVITTGKVHEQKVAPSIPLESGDVAIFDRGYNDLRWYRALDDKGVYFVTRLKKNAYYKVMERRKTEHLKNIYSDQFIELKGFYSHQKFPYRLRRIRSKDPVAGKIIVNALLSQLWIALIAYLLLSYLKFKSRFGWSIYTLSSILPTNLFARRNLWDWLNAPFHQHSNTPLPGPVQLEFAFG